MTRKAAWSLFTRQGKSLRFESILPYTGFGFVLIPLLFLPLGAIAAISVLLNSILAEILTNMHSFLLIVPNQAGDDVRRIGERAW